MHGIYLKAVVFALFAGLISGLFKDLPAKDKVDAYDERAISGVITGYDLMIKGEKQAALDTIAAVVALEPQSNFLKVLYAEVLFQLGRHEEIIRVLKPVMDVKDSPHQAARMMAVSCQSLGRVDEAIGWYQQVLERDPSEEWARRRLLEMLNSRGRYQEMIPVYKYLLDPESENFAFDNFQMGALYMQIGGREPARVYLQQALAADSSLADAHKLLARLDELELKFTPALEHYMNYLELRPDDTSEVMPQVVGMALRAAYPAAAQGDSVNSEDAWRTLIERLETREAGGDSLSPVLRRVSAIAYEAVGRPERALELYNEILKHDPADRFIRRSLLRVMFSREMYEQMIPIYEPLLNSDKEEGAAFARDLFQVGALHLRTGQTQKAREYMLRVLEADSSFADPYRVLGNICENSGEWAAAGKYYLSYIKLQPKSATETFDHLLAASLRGDDLQTPTEFFEEITAAGDTSAATREMLGRLYYHSDKIDEAVNLLVPLAADSALSDNGLYALGFLYSRQENFPEAVAAFETVKHRLPEFVPVYITLSRVFFTMKNFDRAMDALQQGLPHLRKDDLEGRRELLFSMANVYHEMGDDANTVKYLEQVLTESPDYGPALNYLGYYYAERGVNLDEARRLVDRALAEEPGNGHYIDSKGWVLFKMGRKEEALREIRNALTAIGDHPEIYEHLGDIYQALGEPSRALEAWNKSLEMDSENLDLRAKLEKLKQANPEAEGGEK